MDKRDVEVTLADGVLTIRGEKKQEEEEEEKRRDYYRKERAFGCFRRMLAVPGGGGRKQRLRIVQEGRSDRRASEERRSSEEGQAHRRQGRMKQAWPARRWTLRARPGGQRNTRRVARAFAPLPGGQAHDAQASDLSIRSAGDRRSASGELRSPEIAPTGNERAAPVGMRRGQSGNSVSIPLPCVIR